MKFFPIKYHITSNRFFFFDFFFFFFFLLNIAEYEIFSGNKHEYANYYCWHSSYLLAEKISYLAEHSMK